MAGELVLVTGGARRLGAEVVRFYAGAGCRIAIHYNESVTEAEALFEELRSQGVDCQTFQGDLSQAQQVQGLAQRVLNNMGPVSRLIHCASTFLRATILNTSAEQWQQVLSVNVMATALLTQALADGLTQRGGSVVFLSDLSASQAWLPYGAHSVSKAALTAQMKLLAQEMAPSVRVNMVNMGIILPSPQEDTPRRLGRIPLARTGSPSDLLGALQYLDSATYVTGTCLQVDGGRSVV